MFVHRVFSNVCKSNHIYNIDSVQCVKSQLEIYSVEISLVSIIFVNDVGKKFTLVVCHATRLLLVIQNPLNPSFIRPCKAKQSVLFSRAMDFPIEYIHTYIFVFSSPIPLVLEWNFLSFSSRHHRLRTCR